jgi:hypothetical protein
MCIQTTATEKDTPGHRNREIATVALDAFFDDSSMYSFGTRARSFCPWWFAVQQAQEMSQEVISVLTLSSIKFQKFNFRDWFQSPMFDECRHHGL